MEQLGSQVTEEPSAEPVALVDDGFVEFSLAGAPARGEFRCTDCGYGAVVQRVLPVCPMCSGEIWEARPPRY